MEIVGSFILSLVHSILLYGKELGVSMILFQIVFNLVMLYILQKKKRIQNKLGILLIIPILILSSTFFIFANRTFYIANIVIIIILDLLMYVITTNKKDYLSNHLYNTFELFSCTIAGWSEGGKYTKNALKTSNKNTDKEKLKKVIISLLIVVPIVGVVLMLLASADMIFANLFTGIEQFLSNINPRTVIDMIVRIIVIVVSYLLFLSLIFRLQNKYQREELNLEEDKPRDTFTIKMLLIVLNLVYLVFCFIQISSLFGKMNIGNNFDYATYARSGFFQLMFVSFINFIVLLIANKYNKKQEKIIQILSLLLIVFTIIIAMSSMYRMYLYETEYGLTYLRMFVYIILITELVTFIPVIVYIFNRKFDFMKWSLAICLTSYCILNCMNIEKLIVTKNLTRNSIRSIDYKYILHIASEDSYDVLVNKLKAGVSKNEEDKIIKVLMKINDHKKTLEWQEFNISKYKYQKSESFNDYYVNDKNNTGKSKI